MLTNKNSLIIEIIFATILYFRWIRKIKIFSFLVYCRTIYTYTHLQRLNFSYSFNFFFHSFQKLEQLFALIFKITPIILCAFCSFALLSFKMISIFSYSLKTQCFMTTTTDFCPPCATLFVGMICCIHFSSWLLLLSWSSSTYYFLFVYFRSEFNGRISIFT